MKDSMLEILIYIFGQMVAAEDTQLEPKSNDLASSLKKAGFENRDVVKALEWFVELKQQRLALHATHHNSTFRIYSPDEEYKITSDARYVLYTLERDEVITPAIREIIIERAMALDLEEIDVSELKWIMLLVLGAQGQLPVRRHHINNAVLVENLSDAVH